MEIQWVNHASFLIKSKGIRLLVDPWLFGTAFNDSWELMVPSKFTTNDFVDVTHIWFSHEHPDHFSPPVLSAIPETTRRRITVLFQETRDRRVVGFCEKLGFAISELPDQTAVSLASDFSVTCGKVPFYDSWLAVRANGMTLLDLNDCVLESASELRRIRDRLGPIDVLFSQFSYASWFGNASQPENYREAARAMKQQLLQEIFVTKPRFTVPCASFVRFCHVENQHMNQYTNEVGDIAEEIAKQSISTPVVLFPGDVWTVAEKHSNKPAIESYRAKAGESFSFRAANTIPLEEITSLASKYHQKMLRQNNQFAIRFATPLGLLPPVCFHVEDLGKDLRFDWIHGLREIPNGAQADITLSSESLAYLFRFDWGLDTLQVSARFTAGKSGFRKLIRTFSLGSLNNMGLQFGFGLAKNQWFVRRAILKVLRAR